MRAFSTRNAQESLGPCFAFLKMAQQLSLVYAPESMSACKVLELTGVFAGATKIEKEKMPCLNDRMTAKRL